MMYGAETWAVKKAQGENLDVMKMWMLRWMNGVTMHASWTGIGMKEFETQLRREEYPMTCRKVG